jgi:hypothetical protein
MADIPVGDEKREPADAALAVPQLGETRLPAAFDERRAFLVGDLETSARDYDKNHARASRASVAMRESRTLVRRGRAEAWVERAI